MAAFLPPQLQLVQHERIPQVVLTLQPSDLRLQTSDARIRPVGLELLEIPRSVRVAP